MNKEVYQWFNDGHRVLIRLDGESIGFVVVCPGLEQGKKIKGLKCGMGTDEPKGPEDFCWVTEMMAEVGREAHCTGLPIHVRNEIGIEWGYFGDGEEFWFKVAGYPSSMEAKTYREEAFADLFPGETFARANQIAKAIGLFPVIPWSEIDQEFKDQTREEIDNYIEDEERKKANAA